jgi:hypothetical protein
MKRYLIKVELVGKDKKFPSCQETTCGFIGDCANHNSAGYFRVEDGLTPDIKHETNGWVCSRQPANHTGAILVDGTMPYLERYAHPDDTAPSK